MKPAMKDAIINIRVPSAFKKRIVNAISDRSDYSITKVLMEGAEYVIKKLGKNKKDNNVD